jgi:hypothetical protein
MNKPKIISLLIVVTLFIVVMIPIYLIDSPYSTIIGVIIGVILAFINVLIIRPLIESRLLK